MKRYTVEEIENNQFYQMPKFLFDGAFKNISNDSRVLYSLLRDRHQLSIKNKWVNSDNEVYLIYTRDEMADMLGISNKTVLKAINQLKDYELFDETRQGINKPNLIYLTHVSIENTLTCRTYTSRQGESTTLDMENLHGNKTNLINTDLNKTEKGLHQLSEIDDIYIKEYLRIMQYYGYNHKLITTDNLNFISNKLETIQDIVDLEIWFESVKDYFIDLLDGKRKGTNNNDGDIVAFLKASKRIFDIDL